MIHQIVPSSYCDGNSQGDGLCLYFGLRVMLCHKLATRITFLSYDSLLDKKSKS